MGQIAEFMNSGPPFAAALVWITIAAIPVTFLHELGHALAARRLLGGRVHVKVGTAGKLANLRLGQIEASVNAFARPDRVGGYAAFDASRATARDIAWIALAGPFASLAGTLAAALLLSAAPGTGAVHDFLWAAVACGVFAVLNIVPFEFQERRDGPKRRTDGLVALAALRLTRS